MYDSHIYCREYKEIKDYIADIINNVVDDYDVEKIANNIQDLYDTGKMSSSQYDDLISYVQELE